MGGEGATLEDTDISIRQEGFYYFGEVDGNVASDEFLLLISQSCQNLPKTLSMSRKMARVAIPLFARVIWVWSRRIASWVLSPVFSESKLE